MLLRTPAGRCCHTRGLGPALQVLACPHPAHCGLAFPPPQPNSSHPPLRPCRFWLEVTPPSLGKLIEEHGVSVARDICVTSLGWQPRYFEAMMERHREAVATGNISD